MSILKLIDEPKRRDFSAEVRGNSILKLFLCNKELPTTDTCINVEIQMEALILGTDGNLEIRRL